MLGLGWMWCVLAWLNDGFGLVLVRSDEEMGDVVF
jgi:hypothetical protein